MLPNYSLGLSVFTDPNYGQLLYYKPWTRIGAYQVGVLFGLWYYEWMNKENKDGRYKESMGTLFFETIKEVRLVRYSSYIVGFALINLMIFFPHPETQRIGSGTRYYSIFLASLYNAISRPLFVIALAMVIAGPLVGRNKFMKFVLGSRGWVPWARLTFMIYLIHLLIFQWFYGQMRQSVYLDYAPILASYGATVIMSCLLAIPLSAAFEAPFMNIEKYLIFPAKKRPQK